MSGGQIGTVLGGAIGAFFGGPAGAQLGMAIGGFVGNVVDPVNINGPKIGDGQQQSATDGAPIAWVQGTAMVAGTIVQVSKRRQIRHKDGGKGGPTTTTYTAEQDFAILVCESCELRDSTMASVLMVMQDGKIVYDVRNGQHYGDRGVAYKDDAYAWNVAVAMSGMSDSWKKHCDFMFGGEDQLPHPTLEAITGVGNTPAYRGSLTAVFKNFDVTAAGDRIPAFQFVVAQAIDVPPYVATTYSNNLFWDYKDQSAIVGAYQDYQLDEPTHALVIGSINSWATYRVVITLYYEGDSNPMEQDAWNIGPNDIPTASSVLSKVTGRIVYDSSWCSYYGGEPYTTLPGTSTETINRVVGEGAVKIVGFRLYTFNHFGGSDAVPQHVTMGPVAPDSSIGVSLATIVSRICLRGGLTVDDIDVTDLAGTFVAGYPIARQCTAAEALAPLLATYFAYASEYDGKLHFKFYGADAAITIDRDDLIEGNDSSEGNVISNLRNQDTEFPRRIVASYMDPDQNYMTVDVAAARRSIDVKAIGDQSFQIPVVMPADDATKAANKALKVAYATLQGTVEFSVPFAGSAVYMSLAAGEPVLFDGKRYGVDDMTLGNGNLKLKLRYDRQSAYTSNVQAIAGNLPTAPSSPYSGPTTLIPMNLPSLRPQDTYGIYLSAASADGRDSWKGCTVQVSYDGQISWVNAATITDASTFGVLTAAEPTGGEPLTAQMNGDLNSVTDDQIAALANAFALIHSTGTEIGQFKTATETTNAQEYELTDITRGGLGTTQTVGVLNDPLVMLDAVSFLPVDVSFSGKTIYFRAVGFGEVAESATIVSIVYTPDKTVIYDGGTVTP